MTTDTVKHLGNFGVDSGQVIITDPCYILNDEQRGELECVTGAARQLRKENGYEYGLVFHTGDWSYPVYGIWDEDGDLVQVVINISKDEPPESKMEFVPTPDNIVLDGVKSVIAKHELVKQQDEESGTWDHVKDFHNRITVDHIRAILERTEHTPRVINYRSLAKSLERYLNDEATPEEHKTILQHDIDMYNRLAEEHPEKLHKCEECNGAGVVVK